MQVRHKLTVYATGGSGVGNPRLQGLFFYNGLFVLMEVFL